MDFPFGNVVNLIPFSPYKLNELLLEIKDLKDKILKSEANIDKINNNWTVGANMLGVLVTQTDAELIWGQLVKLIATLESMRNLISTMSTKLETYDLQTALGKGSSSPKNNTLSNLENNNKVNEESISSSISNDDQREDENQNAKPTENLDEEPQNNDDDNVQVPLSDFSLFEPPPSSLKLVRVESLAKNNDSPINICKNKQGKSLEVSLIRLSEKDIKAKQIPSTSSSSENIQSNFSQMDSRILPVDQDDLLDISMEPEHETCDYDCDYESENEDNEMNKSEGKDKSDFSSPHKLRKLPAAYEPGPDPNTLKVFSKQLDFKYKRYPKVSDAEKHRQRKVLMLLELKDPKPKPPSLGRMPKNWRTIPDWVKYLEELDAWQLRRRPVKTRRKKTRRIWQNVDPTRSSRRLKSLSKSNNIENSESNSSRINSDSRISTLDEKLLDNSMEPEYENSDYDYESESEDHNYKDEMSASDNSVSSSSQTLQKLIPAAYEPGPDPNTLKAFSKEWNFKTRMWPKQTEKRLSKAERLRKEDPKPKKPIHNSSKMPFNWRKLTTPEWVKYREELDAWRLRRTQGKIRRIRTPSIWKELDPTRSSRRLKSKPVNIDFLYKF